MTLEQIQLAIEHFTALLDTLDGGDDANEVCATALHALEVTKALEEIPYYHWVNLVFAARDGRCIILPAKPQDDCHIACRELAEVLPITVSEYRWDPWTCEWTVYAANGQAFPMKNAFATKEEARIALGICRLTPVDKENISEL